MKALVFRASSLVGAILIFAAPARALSYKATILPMPPGAASAKAYGAAVGSQVGSAFFNGEGAHAQLWDDTSTSSVDLHPLAGYENSTAYAVAGQAQVGDARIVGPFDHYHALLWRGSADSVVDLNPSGYLESTARGVSGDSQVGWGLPESRLGNHALLWHGSAANVVDLHPADFAVTEAYAVSGNSQAGWGRRKNGGPHALLWHGTPESFIDLHPAGWETSALAGISGKIQVGIVNGNGTSSENHAALWRGSAATFVPLHPQGFTRSIAWAAAGDLQVGYVAGPSTVFQDRAVVWNGTSASMLDLHQYLPSSLRLVSSSQATGIAGDGTIVGYAGQYQYAILWTPIVPEPGSGAIFAFGLIMTSLLHRRHRNY